MSDLLTVERLEDGAIRRLVFGKTPGNILDHATLRALTEDLMEARKDENLKGIVLEGAGEHFSYGASVVEHLPDDVQPMLAAVRQLVLTILDMHVVTIGRRAWALSRRWTRAGVGLPSHRRVEGRHVRAAGDRAGRLRARRVDRAAWTYRPRRGRGSVHHRPDRRREGGPARWVSSTRSRPAIRSTPRWRGHEPNLLPRSARSLRYAVQAVRLSLTTTIQRDLPELERLYLDGLMKTEDAIEGVRAFLEKRPPVWTNE